MRFSAIKRYVVPIPINIPIAITITVTISVLLLVFLMTTSCNNADDEGYITGPFPISDSEPLIESPEGLEYLREYKGVYPEGGEFYTVRISAFSNIRDAHDALEDLLMEGYQPLLFETPGPASSPYRLGIGRFDDEESARKFMEGLEIPDYPTMCLTRVRSGRGRDHLEIEINPAPLTIGIDWGMTFVIETADGWEVWYREMGEGQRLIASGEEKVRRPRLSPDRLMVAFVRPDTERFGGSITIVDTYGSKVESTIPSSLPLNYHVWVNSDVIAYVSTSGLDPSTTSGLGYCPSTNIIVYNLTSKRGEILLTSEDYIIKDLSLSPDGRYLVYHASSGIIGEGGENVTGGDESIHVGVIDIKMGGNWTIRAGYTTRFLGWSKDGSLIISFHEEPGSGRSFKYSFAISDVRGEEIVVLEEPGTIKNVDKGVTSPDGSYIAFTTWKVEKDTGNHVPTRLYLFDVDERRITELVKKYPIVYGPTWSPLGDEIAVTIKVNNRWRVYVVSDFDDVKLKKLFDVKDNNYDVHWR